MIAKRIREARKARGVSQDYVAQQIGVTFQQVQKYEHGSNRISAGRLAQIAIVTKFPIDFFFQDIYEQLEKEEYNYDYS